MRVEPQPRVPASPEQPEQAKAAEALHAATPRPGSRFDAVLGQRQANARRALRDDVAQASELLALDPALFSAPRALQLLGYVLDEVLPRLELSDDTRTLAADLLREELYMHEHLMHQRGEASP